MSKRPVVAGNWKMNLTHHEAVNHLRAFSAEEGMTGRASDAIVVIPPFTALPAVQAFV
jgi:triosephosphate isomerase (TIM)